MGLFNRLTKTLFPPKDVIEEPQREIQQERYKVYCQYCGGDLTENGGDISLSGKIYCNEKYKLKRVQCWIIAFISGMEHYNYNRMNYHNAEETQKAIREEKLTDFGELEKKVKEPLPESK